MTPSSRRSSIRCTRTPPPSSAPMLSPPTSRAERRCPGSTGADRECRRRRRRGIRTSATARRVYLICDRERPQSHGRLRRLLMDRGMDVQIPIFEGDAASVRGANQQRLAECDAALVFYGAGDRGMERQRRRRPAQGGCLAAAAVAPARVHLPGGAGLRRQDRLIDIGGAERRSTGSAASARPRRAAAEGADESGPCLTPPPVAVNRNPFPGLRPFRADEEHLFFGREHQVDAMVDKLAATRFLAVVGTSGSGKSSLVNCGLRPALHRGFMAERRLVVADGAVPSRHNPIGAWRARWPRRASCSTASTTDGLPLDRGRSRPRCG